MGEPEQAQSRRGDLQEVWVSKPKGASLSIEHWAKESVVLGGGGTRGEKGFSSPSSQVQSPIWCSSSAPVWSEEWESAA